MPRSGRDEHDPHADRRSGDRDGEHEGPGGAHAASHDSSASAFTRGFARLVTSPLRYLIVLAWIGAAVAAFLFLPSLKAVEDTGPIGILAPKDARALRVEERAVQLFGFPLLSRTMIVQRDPQGLSPPAQGRVIARAARLDLVQLDDGTVVAGALPIINTPALFPFAREQSTTAITYLFFPPDVGLYERERSAERIARDQVNQPGDALVGVTGLASARTAQANLISGALLKVELATVGLIALVVGINFRSPGAPLLTLGTAVIAYLVAVRLTAYAALRLGLALPVELEPLLVVLILAICTDYAVFFLTGTRRRLAVGDERVGAARRTAAEFAPIILTAGITVAACTACLVVARLAFLRDLGPTLALAVAITLVVVITLVPAALASVGRLIFWPTLPDKDKQQEAGREAAGQEQQGSWRTRLIRVTTQRPAALLIAVGCIALLVGAATGIFRLALGLGMLNGLPAQNDAAQAAQAAGRGFAPGIISPTLLLVEEPGLANHQAALARLEGAIEREPGVAGVIGPREQPLDQPLGLVVTRDGGAARLLIILNDDPYSAPAIATVGTLQERLPTLLREVGLPDAQVGIAGDTALARETIDRVTGSIIPVGIAIGVVDFCLLAFLLRALVAPLYLLAASTLAVAAPLGLAVYLFQIGFGNPDLGYYVPIGVGVLLIALGSDYNIFVVGRIWQSARDRPLREAIIYAAPRATRAISVAAITLAASFALLALIPLPTFREFAFAMAAGVLIDSFLVRAYLVSSLITLVGKYSFWPRKR